jgi:phospholipid/cholesterol/gamma-HCH transport system substrate-binding protein
MTTTLGRTGRLRLAWTRVRTVPGLGRDVAALGALVVLGAVVGALILSRLDVTPPWAGRSVVKAEFAEAVAVSPRNSQEVRIAGVEVGKIVDSTPTERGTSVITMELEPGHVVHDNARAVLRPVNPLNQMYVTIDPGGPPGRPLTADDVLPVTQTERPIQADEVLHKLDERSRHALASLLAESDNALATAPETLPAALDATDTALAEVRPVVEKLAQRRENIARLVTAISDVSSALGRDDQRLTALVDATQQTLAVLAERDDEVARALQELPGATEEIGSVLGSLGGLADELDPTLRSVQAASDDLPDALESLADAAGPLREVAQAARPVVSGARPVVAGLRPVVDDLNGALGDLRPISACLDDATSKITPWMYDLGAFVYNTNSLFSVEDPNGGWGRGHATVDLNSPTGAQRPDEHRTNTYRQGGSPLGEYPAAGSGSCQ